ncbi:MAG: hypothetical protein ACREJ2_01780 [Planctomycetota bacterium]
MINRLVRWTAAAGALSLLLSGCGGPSSSGTVSESATDADVTAAYQQAEPNLDKEIQSGTKSAVALGVPMLAEQTASAPSTPATTQAPTTTPQNNPPLSQAEEFLKDYLKGHGNQAAQREDQATIEYNRAVTLYQMENYRGALRFADAALALNPNFQQAQQLRAKVLTAIKGLTPEVVLEQATHLLSNAAAERLYAIERKIAEGDDNRKRAKEYDPDTENDPNTKETLLGERIDSLQKALKNYEDAKTLVDYADLTPYDYGEYRNRVRAAIEDLRKEISVAQEQVAEVRRQVILEREAADQQDFDRAHGEKIGILLDEVRRRISDGRYASAEDLAERVRALENYTGPYNAQATSLRDKANSLKHAETAQRLLDEKNQSIRTEILAVEQRHIPYQQLIVYPDDWDHVVARQAKQESLSGGSQGTPEWKREIEEKLQKTVDFHFPNEQLKVVLDYLRDRAGVSFVYNPAALQDKPPVQLDVTGMTIQAALKLVLQTSGGNLGYVIRDHAVYIDDLSKLNASGGGMILVPYDVGDITVAVRDFVGPDITLDSGSTLPPPPPPPATPPPDINTILTLIQSTIAPDSWNAGGASADAFGDKLFINQRPDVHDQIARFLAEYRATQKVMVSVESRFLEVRDADFQEIGMEIQGLNTLNQFYNTRSGLRGDFGDITGIYRGFVKTNRANTATGYIAPAASNSVPVPGFVSVSAPSQIGSNGIFSLVGSSVTSFINYARQIDPGSPAISALEGEQGDVTAGGLNAQLFYSNGVQLNAYIHAVHATENTATVFAPRLTIRNGQRAYVVVARQEAYIRDYNTNGQLLQPVVDSVVEGVALDVRPIVSYDRRYVTLDMNPTLSQIVKIRQIPISNLIIDQLTGTPIGAVTSIIEAPQLFMHKVRTSAMIPDGGVLYISGMYRDIKFDAENSVPILGDIPVVGRLFRWTVGERAKQNTAMVISPRIILLDEEERKHITGSATEN